MKVRESFSDRMLMWFIYGILGIFALICLYPLYLVIISSFSNPSAVALGEVTLYPVGPTIEAYMEAFRDDSIMIGYRNSLLYTILGTALNMLLTIPAAYSLAHPKVKGKGVVMGLIVFTMYFSGGLIPSFLLMRELNFSS